jgi:hypothetical protein
MNPYSSEPTNGQSDALAPVAVAVARPPRQARQHRQSSFENGGRNIIQKVTPADGRQLTRNENVSSPVTLISRDDIDSRAPTMLPPIRRYGLVLLCI